MHKACWDNRKFMALLSGILTAGILLFLFVALRYAPFGSRTLATMDANIQYLDFFAYFKNVLQGKDRISYSFGKALGGNG